MKDSLVTEYKKLKKREKKLDLEGKNLQREHYQNVTYFIDNHIFDRKSQKNLEKTACNLGSASIRMKIAKMKMEQIRINLSRKEGK